MTEDVYKKGIYPINFLLSDAFVEVHKKDKNRFVAAYEDVMKNGSSMPLTAVWDKLFGEKRTYDQSFFDQQFERLLHNIRDTRLKLADAFAARVKKSPIEDGKPVKPSVDIRALSSSYSGALSSHQQLSL